MIKDKKGFLLPMAAVFIIIMVIIGMAILYLGTLERLETKRRLNREKAFYLAEAGAYRAYAHLKEDSDWEPEEEPLPLGEGTFLVEREDGDNYINIISTGNVKGVEEKVKLTFLYTGIWSYGIYGKDTVELQGNVEILGYDSRDGSSSNDYYVGSEGNVTVGGSSSISGVITEYYSLPFPDIEVPSELLNMNYTIHGDPGISGNYEIKNHNFSTKKNVIMSSGNYKFNDFELSSANANLTITGDVNLYIEGKFSMSVGNISLAQNSKLKIYFAYPSGTMDVSGGSINKNGYPMNVEIYSLSYNPFNIGGNAEICAVLYAPYVEFIASRGTPVFKGSIVSQEITTKGTVSIYYDVSLKDKNIGPTVLVIKRWTKPDWINRLQ